MTDHCIDVTLEDFEAKVFRPSAQTPVLVDFWAPWCGPCKTLTPLLEKLAQEYAGRFLLAKVNSDENPELAHHFGVRSIPTVKVLFGGQLVDEFAGALTEGELRNFLDRLLPPAQPGLREQAATLAAEGRLEEALALLAQATRDNPDDEGARLDAADLLLELGRKDEAGHILASEFVKETARAQALRSRLALAEGGADIAALEAQVASAPENLGIRLELSQAYAAAGRYRDALEAAIEVVRRDRHYDDAAARKAVLKIFEALGSEERYDDLIREYRRTLASALN